MDNICKKIAPLFVLMLTWPGAISNALAFEPFTVEDIRLEGLQRISAGTVFNYLPVKIGEPFTPATSERAIQSLFETGFFNDVTLSRDGNVLIVNLFERPAIAQLIFNGNEAIETEELKKNLKEIGLSEGRTFNRATLAQVEQELNRVYFSQGKYAASIKGTVTPQPRNRVNIQIDIEEGDVAKIRRISIVGNTIFDDEELLKGFELGIPAWYQFFSDVDQYSKEKLSGDLETLQSYYQDRGYINFAIESTQVSLTPDKKDIYITVNIDEGEKYKVSEINLLGDLILPEEELRRYIFIRPGMIFIRQLVTTSTETITDRLGNEGYAFANVNFVPELNEEEKTVALNFFVDPGKRVYVRRINFIGNTKTRDEVLRREMRQMEGGWASTERIKLSQTRLERLRFFEEVNVETKPLPDVADQVDVEYTVVERPSGNFTAGLGYAQTQGLLINASVVQDNFLGTGNRVAVTLNTSRFNQIYSTSFTEPYYTIDGISRSMSLFFRKTDAAVANLSRFTLDTYGFSLAYGVPISEFNSIRLGIDAEQIEIGSGIFSPVEVSDFIERNGDNFTNVKVTGGWVRDTRNRGLFPTRGMLQSFLAEVSLPIGGLDFYKLNYRHEWYYPIWGGFIAHLKGDIGYGDSYSNQDYPFFENFSAGGPRSVRGYEENTLGPEDSNGNTFGGNLRIVGNMEMILPIPFLEDNNSARVVAFFDAGNVYGIDETFSFSDLRYSAGLAATWLSPLGAITFSVAQPFKEQPGDETQVFQFTLGTAF